MVKILVVDDESIVRIAFKTLVDWHKLDCKIIEASNGQEALEKLCTQEIHILITDIKMPVMDGLELITKAKKANENLIVIVLSSFDEFELVKNAFKLGIMDYILKPEMGPDMLVELYHRAVDLLACRDSTLNESVSTEDAGLENNMESRKTILKDFVGGKSRNEQELMDNIDKLDIKLDGKYFAAGVLKVDDYPDILARYGETHIRTLVSSILNIISNNINNLLDKCYSVEKFSESEDSYVLIFSCSSTANRQACEKTVMYICERISESIKRYINVQTSWGISPVSTKGFKNLPELYNQALETLQCTFIMGRGKIIWYDAISDLFNMETVNNFDLMHYTNLMNDFLETVSSENIRSFFSSILVTDEKINPKYFESIIRIYSQYYHIISAYLGKRNFYKDIKWKLDKYYRSLKNGASLYELNTLLEDMLMSVHNGRNIENYLVKKVKKFINENFIRPVTLREAAEFASVSEEHLSRQFTEETGESFSKYLMRTRINKAKEYLSDKNLKVYEVAYKVGYSSTEHFTRKFKEFTGITPREYMDES